MFLYVFLLKFENLKAHILVGTLLSSLFHTGSLIRWTATGKPTPSSPVFHKP